MDTTPVKQWVLLVAGSKTWDDYCDQANICHAYQIVRRNKIPAEQIVVMMYDDIAHNDRNPTPGVLISSQSELNVYEGVQKDYTGEDVTPKNFLSVLTGNEAAVRGIGSGRVIKSKPQDNIFIYFSGHGSEGQLSFPDSNVSNNFETSHDISLRMVTCASGSEGYRLKPISGRDLPLQCSNGGSKVL
uniref:Legumain n=1 Tax=Callorhinchus milii TaxID=7868 RepID=A0A4W3JBG1_CALMI